MITKIKGTKDYSPSETNLFEYIRNVFLFNVGNYNFNYIETPIIESADVYKRSVAGSDIVQKEMYEFKDRGDRDIALRPEGTAGFVRALIENKWYAQVKTTKFAYYGPMFRYEQPQKGRQRQFYQAGVESISKELNPYIDAELIIMASNILKTLNVGYILKINSIGDTESRERYQKVLKDYFSKYKKDLTELSQQRIETNVLRILDDKIDSKKDFVKKAPKINKYLSAKSSDYFKKLLKILDDSNIKYQVDYSLVRGLDYYDEVVYEFVSNSEHAGSQSTLIGGGRYSTLINELGGPKLTAAGWGFGIDRIAQILQDDKLDMEADLVEKVDIVIASLKEENKNALFELANELRSYGVKIEFMFDTTKTKKIFDCAKKLKADFVIFDDDMLKDNMFLVKELKKNDKLAFQYTEDGFLNLLEFLSENELKSINDLDILLGDEE